MTTSKVELNSYYDSSLADYFMQFVFNEKDRKNYYALLMSASSTYNMQLVKVPAFQAITAGTNVWTLEQSDGNAGY